MSTRATARCPLCTSSFPVAKLSAATWLAPEVVARVHEHFPNWEFSDGACPNCTRRQLERVLTEVSLSPPRDPLPGRKLPAWECLTTPYRTAADARFFGHGVTIAMIDAAFYPHPDLIRPRNRIRAWVDATLPTVRARFFQPGDTPKWPGWDRLTAPQWHGLMASGVAAGNGRLSHGLYRGIASEANLILIQTMDRNRRITNLTLSKALRWLIRNGPELGLSVINFSVAGDPLTPAVGNAVDELCEELLDMDITIVAAVGNSGRATLVTPSTCPGVLSVGGIDDRDRLDPKLTRLWNSSYGAASDGTAKPQLVAPSWRVVAPLLPKSSVAKEANELFARRLLGDESAEPRIDDEKLVTPHYQHMDGTSVAAPIVSSVVACMLQINPGLSPARVLELITSTARPLPDVPQERCGAGAVQAGAAVAAALAERFDHKHRRSVSRSKGS